MSDLLLPEGARLLHIGPHKTGTTSIQSALVSARPRLKEFGVIYPGNAPQHMHEALYMTGGKGLIGGTPATARKWNRLLSEVRGHDAFRVVISSEYFDDANDDAAAKVVEALGGERVHVVVTLRRLAEILPSAWQQYVRNRLRVDYDDWLDHMLNKPPYIQPTTTFWSRHRHDALVERWAQIVGPENLTVIVIDSSDRDFQLRVFEQMLDLPEGFLVPDPARSNRSFSLSEIELVRWLNKEIKRQQWPNEAYFRMIREGTFERLPANREVKADEARIATPQWALDRVAEIGAEAALRIQKTGVRILGDISLLGTAPPTSDSAEVRDASGELLIPVSLAGQAVLLAATAQTPQEPEPAGAPAAAAKRTAAPALSTVPAGVLLREVRGRLRHPLKVLRRRARSFARRGARRTT